MGCHAARAHRQQPDPRLRSDGPAHRPIFDHNLQSRIHLPMCVHGEVIGALSCSRQEAGFYRAEDVRNSRYIAEMLSPCFFAQHAANQSRQSAIVETRAHAREEALRQSALKLTKALEQERQRIGLDLHDQTLADLTRLARGVERLRLSDSIAPADLAPLGHSLHLSIQALRQIIEAAKPSVLHLFGFAHAVENHLDRAIRDAGSGARGTLTDQTCGVIDTLDPSVGVALFRIVREAVNNAVTHAQASCVGVDLTLSRGQVAVTIGDNVRGMPRTRA